MGILNDEQEEYNQQAEAKRREELYAYHQQTNPRFETATVNVPASGDFYKFRLTSDDHIQDFIAWLEGKIPKYDEYPNKTFVKVSQPQLNQEGINFLASTVSSFLNKTIFLGCLTEEQILLRMNDFMKKLAYSIRLNYNKWELHSSKRDLLLLQICDMAQSAISRSWEGREADQLSTAISRIEHTQKNETPTPQLSTPARFLSRLQR